MKHRIIIILSMLTMGFLPTLAEDNYFGVALLSHQGNQTAYAADNVQAAVDDAVEGDTIQFSNGHFKEITLNKKVYLKILNNELSVNLRLPDNSAWESSQFIGGPFTVWVRCNLQSIYLVRFAGHLYIDNQYKVGSVTFDRCALGLDFSCFNVDNLYANNCIINDVFNGETTTTISEFKNCGLNLWSFSISNTSFENCTFYNNREDIITIDNCTLTNCMYDPNRISIGDNTKVTNSYLLSQDEWNSNTDYLLSKGFLSTDNQTVVGCYGGSTPYEGIAQNVPNLWKDDDDEFIIKGKTIIGNWKVSPKR